MGLLVLLIRSFAMLSVIFLWLTDLGTYAQLTSSGPTRNARALDALLQDYAYRAFVRPRTGIPYNGTVPSNITGIKVSAIRLRSGSLFRKGVNFTEFQIPPGLLATPYVERLVLVSQNLGKWSVSYYPLEGYAYLAPILGLLAYDASNLSGKNLPELELRAAEDKPISIKFRNLDPSPDRSAAKCVTFDLNGSPSFSNVVSGNVCTALGHGHFSIVVPSIAPSPAPVAPKRPRGKGKKDEKVETRTWIIVGSVIGGLVLGAVIGLLVIWCRKFRERKKMRKMERASEAGEALHMTPIGETKAPAASVTRTQPVLESEYVP